MERRTATSVLMSREQVKHPEPSAFLEASLEKAAGLSGQSGTKDYFQQRSTAMPAVDPFEKAF